MATSGGRVPADADGFYIIIELNPITDVGGTYQEQEDSCKTPHEGDLPVRHVVLWHRELPYEVRRFWPCGTILGKMQTMRSSGVGIKTAWRWDISRFVSLNSEPRIFPKTLGTA